jgi:hypothetical protein
MLYWCFTTLHRQTSGIRGVHPADGVAPASPWQAPQAVEAVSDEANKSAHIIATNAEPIAEAFVDNQLRPRAYELAENLEPQVPTVAHWPFAVFLLLF